MPYILKSYRGINPDITVNEKQRDSGSTSISFIGKDYEPYGEIILTNLYNMLENFAGGIPPSNPIIGQLWFDTTSNKLKTYTTGGTWESVGGFEIGSSFPSSPNTGDMFFYDNGNDKILYIYDGTNWIAINDLRISSTLPTSAVHNGTLWFNTNDYNLYIYINGTFKKLLIAGTYGTNRESNISYIDFVSLSASTTAYAQLGIVTINNDMAMVISDTEILSTDLSSESFVTKDGNTITYSSVFPDKIEKGININQNFSNLQFSNTDNAYIINSKNTGTLNFKIGNNINVIIRDSKIDFQRPLEFTNTDYMKLPVGSSALRPPTPQAGQIRYNQATNLVEYFNGTVWVPIKSASSTVMEAPLTKTAYGYWSYAHGLGVKPKLVIVHLRCVSAHLGYAPGDDVYLEEATHDEAAGPRQNYFVYGADNNEIFARIFQINPDGDSIIIIPHKANRSFAYVNLTVNTSWQLIAKYIP